MTVSQTKLVSDFLANKGNKNNCLKCIKFDFTCDNVISFQSWDSVILIMPVRMTTAFDTIKITFDNSVTLGAGKLGLFLIEDRKVEVIDSGLLLSGRGAETREPCEFPVGDFEKAVTGGIEVMLFPRCAGKYGDSCISLRYPGGTVKDFLIENKGAEYVQRLESRLTKAKPTDMEKKENRPWSPGELFLGFTVFYAFPLNVTKGSFEAMIFDKKGE